MLLGNPFEIKISFLIKKGCEFVDTFYAEYVSHSFLGFILGLVAKKYL